MSLVLQVSPVTTHREEHCFFLEDSTRMTQDFPIEIFINDQGHSVIRQNLLTDQPYLDAEDGWGDSFEKLDPDIAAFLELMDSHPISHGATKETNDPPKQNSFVAEARGYTTLTKPKIPTSGVIIDTRQKRKCSKLISGTLEDTCNSPRDFDRRENHSSPPKSDVSPKKRRALNKENNNPLDEATKARWAKDQDTGRKYWRCSKWNKGKLGEVVRMEVQALHVRNRKIIGKIKSSDLEIGTMWNCHWKVKGLEESVSKLAPIVRALDPNLKVNTKSLRSHFKVSMGFRQELKDVWRFAGGFNEARDKQLYFD